MQSTVIVTARQLPQPIVEHLSQLGEVRVYNPEEPAESLNNATVWLGTAMDPVPATLIDTFPGSVGLIANLGVGTDNIDIAAASRLGIEVSNTPVVTQDTADLTMALLLATCRRLGECERALRADNWAAGAAMLGRRVHGATLGIVGFGAIGQALAKRAQGFDMAVLYHGPNPKPEAAEATGAQYRESFAQLVGDADIICLTCPLAEDTRHIVNAKTLEHFKPGAILINTGRGPLVDEAALVNALQNGQLAGAGLDVFEFEPSVTPALMSLDNVVLLPHIGSATAQCRMDIAGRALANIKAYVETGHAIDLVSI